MVNTEIRLIIFLQPKMEKLYTVSKNKTRSDCGSDHELIAKFRLKLKKVGKSTRTFRYDLNQILRLSKEALQIAAKKRRQTQRRKGKI